MCPLALIDAARRRHGQAEGRSVGKSVPQLQLLLGDRDAKHQLPLCPLLYQTPGRGTGNKAETQREVTGKHSY